MEEKWLGKGEAKDRRRRVLDKRQEKRKGEIQKWRGREREKENVDAREKRNSSGQETVVKGRVRSKMEDTAASCS